MKIKITYEEIMKTNEAKPTSFPKYTSQLMNWANQNAQGTRPRVVGQLSEIFPMFLKESEEKSLKKWEEWYNSKFPSAIEVATEKVCSQIENLKEAILLIDKGMVRDWIKDLVITKTYNGFYFQESILSAIAKAKGIEGQYRLASSQEESKGIDGFVGGSPYSIKPDTYKTMSRLSETIEVDIVYYTKGKNYISIELSE